MCLPIDIQPLRDEGILKGGLVSLRPPRLIQSWFPVKIGG